MSAHADPGLVFAVPLSEQTYGFGQLIAWQNPIFYMVAYDARSELPVMEEKDLSGSRPVLMGNFFDVLLRNGRWKPVKRLSLPGVAFPCFKIRIGETFYVESWDRRRRREATPSELAFLQPRSNYGPIILENALKAHFGLRPWETMFEPLKAESVAKTSSMC